MVLYNFFYQFCGSLDFEFISLQMFARCLAKVIYIIRHGALHSQNGCDFALNVAVRIPQRPGIFLRWYNRKRGAFSLWTLSCSGALPQQQRSPLECKKKINCTHSAYWKKASRPFDRVNSATAAADPMRAPKLMTKQPNSLIPHAHFFIWNAQTDERENERYAELTSISAECERRTRRVHTNI